MNRLKLFAILALLAGPFVLFMNYQESSEKSKIDKDGTQVEAIVLVKNQNKGRKGRVDREFELVFPAGDAKTPVQKTVDVSKALFERVTEANPMVNVKYLKDDPQKLIIVGEPMGEPLLYAVGAALLAFGLGGTWWFFIRKPPVA